MTSNVVIAIAAVVTALATVFIAWFTKVNKELVSVQRNMLESHRVAEQNAKSPILVLGEKTGAMSTPRDARTLTRVFLIRNVGFGPALNVRYTIEGQPEGTFPKPLGIQDDQRVDLATSNTTPWELTARVTIQYSDVFGRTWTAEVERNMVQRVQGPKSRR